MRLKLLTVASLVLFLAIVVTARAQERAQCRPDSESIIAELQKDWGEDVVAMALNGRGNLVRILVNPDTRTWSLVTSMPGTAGKPGAGCLNVSGVGFESMPSVPLGPES